MAATDSAVHVDHANGLAIFIEHNITSKIDRPTFMFFDYDRLLTNGYELSGKGQDSELNKRIRGGQATLNALSEAKAKGIEMFVVTARSPSLQVIEQLKSSMKGPQKELQEYFDIDSEAKLLKFMDLPIATNESLFATGYQKELAIGMKISSFISEGKIDLKGADIYFFDDAVVNCFSVLESWRKNINLKNEQEETILRSCSFTSVWCDPFFEETEIEGTPTMVPVHSESSDFNYHEFLEKQCAKFGISNEERDKRRQVYLDEEKKYGRKPPSSLIEKPPPAKKLENVEKKFAGLGNLFNKRP